MEPEELEIVVREFQSPLELFAQQWTEHAQDVVQTAFLKLYRNDSFVENKKSWLFRTVRNLSIDAHRSESRRKHRERVVGQNRIQVRLDEESPFDGNEVLRELEGLDLNQREIVIAKIWGGLNFEEIAQLFQIAVSTAHRRYHQAILKLQQRLESECHSSKTK